MEVLRVMGLVGRHNSFVLRHVRNPNGVVAQRLNKVRQDPGDDEPFARLPQLVDDFIAINGFDERGVETMRSLRPQEALQVMGFSAENTFVIRGVKNPNAALMSRVASARRHLNHDDGW